MTCDMSKLSPRRYSVWSSLHERNVGLAKEDERSGSEAVRLSVKSAIAYMKQEGLALVKMEPETSSYSTSVRLDQQLINDLEQIATANNLLVSRGRYFGRPNIGLTINHLLAFHKQHNLPLVLPTS